MSAKKTYTRPDTILAVAGRDIPPYHRIDVRADVDVALTAGGDEAQILMLQGKTIAEPVVKYGPFVMSTPQEIRQAYEDYQRTRFGGWPWPRHDPVHGGQGRFARHADGRLDQPA